VPRLGVLVICVFLAGAAYGAYALLARFVLHGTVTARTLFVSVENASGSPGALFDDRERCLRPRRARDWRCQVMDDEASGGMVTYRVRLRPQSSCWVGQIRNDYPGSGMPTSIEGCVYRWQWRLLDAF